MATIKLPFVSCFDDRHGKRRYRFRRKGHKTIMLHGLPGSAEFMTEYQAALAQAPFDVAASRVVPGSISALIAAYYISAEWRLLAPSTQRMRRNILERFRASSGQNNPVVYGNRPVRALAREHLLAIRDRFASTPHQANKLIRVLHALLSFGIDRNLLRSNPAAGIKPLKVRSEGFHAWTDEEVETFERHHPIGTDARLAFEMLACLGQRRADVVRIGRQHLDGNSIVLRQGKTGTQVVLPIADDLKRALDLVPKKRLTLLETSKGKPYSPAYFGNVFRRWCDEAGLQSHCRAHGLRKFTAKRLAEAGHSTHEIQSITGHRRLADVAHYTRSADQKRLAEGLQSSLTRTRTELFDGKPEIKAGNPTPNPLMRKG